MSADVVFWASLGFIAYATLGYPCILAALRVFRRRTTIRAPIRPRVSLIITAHNEAGRIGEKIENALEQDYPRELYEVIVASDCSTDGTDDIVRQYASRGVRLVRSPERLGKEAAQRRAILEATGEVLVFSDVATRLDPSGVRTIVESFADPSVGCVTSVDRVIDEAGRPVGEGVYVRYEMWLRRLETEVNSVVGLSGSFFAARRAVCEEWPTDLPSDFATLLRSVQKGLRGVADERSVGYYRNIRNEAQEYERKVRTVVRGMAAFFRVGDLLNPFRYGLFSWQLFTHKLCRWLLPFALIACMGANVVLAQKDTLYTVILAAQGLVYGLAVAGMRGENRTRGALVRLSAFFLVVNLAILTAWYRFIRGERVTVWAPSKR